ncbi:S-formylglutathione hydrolase [Hydrogenophaga sp. RAC07]|uniref:S-formylglutathione hydrolase n=1 Tax=Hydrogenophaga sp. RAC07 TaxID=1842537 RepID=UPI00083E5531|nr:S-formylglutathione hydrolase [Hydrogenophaga sp. RAC07]AOF83920.1 S-formylglutathione hydrolase [Hydrogenophaga sp. RAC07]
MGIETLSEHRCFGGVQGFYKHASTEIGLPMKFGVYLPPQAQHGPVPVVFFLAGLTCNEETFAIKAGAQRYAAELGLAIVTPDTSPRDTGIEVADASWDFGHGAGFYLDATQEPWAKHFRMESWITKELRDLVLSNFPTRPDRVGISGHSMGGHGALTLALRHPGLYQSVSAIAPICAPSQCPWGEKAFTGYLGTDRAGWAEHDAVELIKSGRRVLPLLVDQGLADKFLSVQLNPQLLEQVCRDFGQPLEVRRHEGYDHGYWLIASVVADHIRHHAGAA